MQLVTMLAVVVTYPVLCLGFVLWMARFEDSLPDAVRKAVRTPDPPPILAIPVLPRDEPVEPGVPVVVDLVVPEQRSGETETLPTTRTG
jgi:hypothetical protein